MIGYINDLVYVCGPTPLQMGVANGIMKLPDSFYQKLGGQYDRKRKRICQVLSRIGLTPYVPKGAYYILADVGKLPGRNSKAKAMYLLEKTGVATVPGKAFYHAQGGENIVRFCFAKSEPELAAASRRLLTL
jgi:aminotransferase